MPLLKCPECGHDVSSFADKCPNCGCPISVIINDWELKEKQKQQEIKKQNEKKQQEALKKFLQIAEENSSEKDYLILKNQIDNGLKLDWEKAAEKEADYYENKIGIKNERPQILYSGIVDAIFYQSESYPNKTSLTNDQIFSKLSSTKTIEDIFETAKDIFEYTYPIIQNQVKSETAEWYKEHAFISEIDQQLQPPFFVGEQLPHNKKEAAEWYARFEAAFIYEVIHSEEKRSNKQIITNTHDFLKSFVKTDPTDEGQISLNKNLTSNFSLVADQVSLCFDVFTRNRQFIS